jgi:23S rRNA pseudouridine1911/1915/1917 synthase
MIVIANSGPLITETSEVGQTSEVLFSDQAGEDADIEAIVTLTAADSGGRLDKWLTGQLPERSRSEIQRWIEAGLVTLGPRPLKASYKVTAGDEISVAIPEPEDYALEPEPIPLDVLYEDADLLVVNKPAGMVVHPAAGNWHGTLVNAVLHHCPDLEGVGGARRPGIVHRLDRDTSGLILVAKNDAAHRNLQAQFKARTVEKTYLALVYGRVRSGRGEINAPIGRDPRQRQRMAVVSAALGRAAATKYEVVRYYKDQTRRVSASSSGLNRYTLLICRPLTGRTHQIRVHLAHIGHPVVGDTVYGGRHKSLLLCPRQFLHAERIRFRLPGTGAETEFIAPLPADLQAVLDVLMETLRVSAAA